MVQRNIARGTHPDEVPSRGGAEGRRAEEVSVMNFDPFSQWGKVFQAWQKLGEDSMVRANAFFAEVEKAEAKRIERAESAIEEMARIQKETIAYGAQLGAEWRKVSLDAFQKAAALANTAPTA
jgi:hypothetical protein